MKLAVVGANGFIGARLVEQCVLRGWADVVAIVRRPSAAASCLRFDIECRVANALDQRAMVKVLDGCDAVVHAAAGDRQLVVNSGPIVFQAARQARLECMVYLSSMAVHGWNPPLGTTEATPLRANHSTPYNNWKVLAERRLAALARRSSGDAGRSTRLVVLRPGIVWGPRSQWVRRFVSDLLADRAYVVDGGTGVCNAVYVDNLNSMILQAITGRRGPSSTLLVGDDRPATWRELYEPLCRAMGRDWSDVIQLEPIDPRPTLKDRYVALRDSRAMQRLLRWCPVRLRFAASQAVDAWFDNPLRREVAFEPAEKGPEVTREMVLLQQCRYKFPLGASEHLRDAASIVPPDEAMRRTIGWLEFAGYLVERA